VQKKSVRVSPLNLLLNVVDEDLGVLLYQLTATANVDIDNRHHHLGHMKAVIALSQVTINYFNWYKEITEPLLEPWNFQIKIIRHPLLPTKFVLQSSGKMELNITRPFLELTSRVLSEKKWSDDSSSSSSSSSSVVANRFASSPSFSASFVSVLPRRVSIVNCRPYSASAGWRLSVPGTR
jgi:hypothetical protein